MKNLMIACLVTLALTVGSIAKAGDWSSGGGDTTAQEFATLGYDIYRYFTWIDDQRRAEYGIRSLYSYQQTLQETKVRSEEHVFLDGKEVDAINTPDRKEIVVNRSRWSAIQNEKDRAPLVLHEYLGILRVDDTHYQHSHLLVGSYTPVGKLNPPVPTWKNEIVLDLPDNAPLLPDDFEAKAEQTLKDQGLYYFHGTYSMSAAGTITLDAYKLASDKLQVTSGMASDYISKYFGVQKNGCLANAIWNFAANYHQFYDVAGIVITLSQTGDYYSVGFIPTKVFLSMYFEERIKKFLPRLRELAIAYDSTCGG